MTPATASPGTQVNETISGTTVNGSPAVHQAEAELGADASLSGYTGISVEVRAAAELALMAMSYEQVVAMSEREISRDLLHVRRSRVAGQLKQARLAAEPARLSAPAIEMDPPVTSGMIASPRGGGAIG
jgi:hypothetical protein